MDTQLPETQAGLGESHEEGIDNVFTQSDQSSDNIASDSEEEYLSDADEEWAESIRQIEMLLSVVLVPFIGKYFGRKFAFYAWGKYMEAIFPVSIDTRSRRTFNAVGVGAVASSP